MGNNRFLYRSAAVTAAAAAAVAAATLAAAGPAWAGPAAPNALQVILALQRQGDKVIVNRTGGKPLSGYYSFVEDFRRDTKSVHETRRARFGNGWLRTTKGDWVALNRARFTASGAEWESKDNIDAGLNDGWFYLATGGAITKSRELRSLMELPAPVALPDFGVEGKK